MLWLRWRGLLQGVPTVPLAGRKLAGSDEGVERVEQVFEFGGEEEEARDRPRADASNVAWAGGTVLFLAVVVLIFAVIAAQGGWEPHAPPNPATCQCECWDGLFKGAHPRSTLRRRATRTAGATVAVPGEYKSVFFNLELHTALLFALVLLYAEAGLVSFRGLVASVLAREARWDVVVAFGVAVYPNFYSCWGLFNYLNDRSAYLFWNQVYFSIGELVAASGLFRVRSRRNVPSRTALLVTFFVSLSHVLGNVCDNVGDFVARWASSAGAEAASPASRQARDLAFLASDIVSLVVTARLLHAHHHLPSRGSARGFAVLALLSAVLGVALPRLMFALPVGFLYRFPYAPTL